MVGLLTNKLGRDELQIGDHIYVWRHSYIYVHHGIYDGKGNVIHFTRGNSTQIMLERFIFASSDDISDPPCRRCGHQWKKTSGVVLSCLECFLHGGQLHLFRYGVSPALFLAKARGGTCTIARSDPPENVLLRARLLLHKGSFGKWDLFKNNCEDFAIYCKTGLLSSVTAVGVGQSGQAAALIAAGSAVVSSTVLLMVAGVLGGAVGFGMYCVGRIVADIGVRSDVIKVPVEKLFGCSFKEVDELQARRETSNVTVVPNLMIVK